MGLDGTGGCVAEREVSRRVVAERGLESGDAAEEEGDNGVYLLFVFIVFLVTVLSGMLLVFVNLMRVIFRLVGVGCVEMGRAEVGLRGSGRRVVEEVRGDGLE